ncbi:MAG TPA: hypothetical protein VJJ02_01755 [Candidatus Paceibacterota bacterium]
MELTEQEKVDELLKLEKDNNHMLHRMRRSMVWSQVFTFLYWLFILGAIGWSYYFFQPYIEKYWGIYQSATKTLEGLQKTGNSLPGELQGILDKAR